MKSLVTHKITNVISFNFKGVKVDIDHTAYTTNASSHKTLMEMIEDCSIAERIHKKYGINNRSNLRDHVRIQRNSLKELDNYTIRVSAGNHSKSYDCYQPFNSGARGIILELRRDIFTKIRNSKRKFIRCEPTTARVYAIFSHADYYNRASNLNLNDERITVIGSRDKGFVHASPNQILNIARARRNKRLFNSVSPKTQERHIGVEIECGVKVDKQELAELMQELAGYVQIKSDGSVRVDNREAVEIAVCAPLSQYKNVLKRVTNILNSERVSAKVNKTCGLHVHLDVREHITGFNTDYDALNDKYAKLVSVQSILYGMQPKSRQNNTYCMRSKKRTISRSGSRYQGINAQAIWKYRTIETRLHAGTTDFQKIANWIDLLTGVMYSSAPTPKRSLSSVRSFFRTFSEVPTNLMEYVVERINKFQDVNAEEAELSQVV